MGQVQSIAVAAADAEIRLDRWFKRHFPDLSHGKLEQLLRTGQIRLDGKRAAARDRVAAGQVVRVPPLRHRHRGQPHHGRRNPARATPR